MKNIDLKACERELKKRWEAPYKWGQKQNDIWDRHSNFIYEIKEWERLKIKVKEIAKVERMNEQEFLNYSSNRWYNFWSAMALEKVFSEMDGIEPALNAKNKLVDFNIKGINFDFKTSVFPFTFGQSVAFARNNPEKLVEWFYQNQSSQKRQHFANRLFLVVYAANGQHWQLKAEINWLKSLIDAYVIQFDAKKLIKSEFQPGELTLSDIIWAIK